MDEPIEIRVPDMPEPVIEDQDEPKPRIPVKIVYDDGTEWELSRAGWLGNKWHVKCDGPFFTTQVINVETGFRLAVTKVTLEVSTASDSHMLITVPNALFGFEVREGTIYPVRPPKEERSGEAH